LPATLQRAHVHPDACLCSLQVPAPTCTAVAAKSEAEARKDAALVPGAVKATTGDDTQPITIAPIRADADDFMR
jgi:hypothetical protein